MGNNTAEIRRSIKGAESDLAQLQKTRGQYSGRELKDVDGQIKTIKETIKLYRSML